MIKRIVRTLLKSFHLRLVLDGHPTQPGALLPEDRLSCFFVAIKSLGFNPKHIVDVGANRGSWTRAAFSYFPDARYTLVEPQDQLKVHIQDLVDRGCEITWINAGVSDHSSILPFTISYRDDSSTFAPTHVDAEATQISVIVKTLNEIVSASSGSPPEMVKIDAEGFDLKVLAGASDLLGKTDIFLVEVAVWCPERENTIAKVVRWMDLAGYRLVDITDMNRSPKYGVLWLCELAFLREASSLLAGVASYE